MLTALGRSIGCMTAVVAAAAVAQPASAPVPTATASVGVDRAARSWAASCNACHGPDGRTQGAVPLLAGRDAEQLATALLEYKYGKRPEATLMHQHAKGYTDDEIRRIARHFSTLPATAPLTPPMPPVAAPVAAPAPAAAR